MFEQRTWGWKIKRGVGIFVLAVAAVSVLGYVVMALWNGLMPPIFGLRTIHFWQGLGLLVLARILFGGLHHGRGHGFRRHHRMMRNWDSMTPEEREKFRHGARHRCCGGGEQGQA